MSGIDLWIGSKVGGNQDRLRKMEILGVGEMVAEIEVKKERLKKFKKSSQNGV